MSSIQDKIFDIRDLLAEWSDTSVVDDFNEIVTALDEAEEDRDIAVKRLSIMKEAIVILEETS